jgi:hypothetical protein
MPRVCDNGVYRDMTPEEEKEWDAENNGDALTQMISAMSTATTVAQMRAAAKSFLEKTEVS